MTCVLRSLKDESPSVIDRSGSRRKCPSAFRRNHVAPRSRLGKPVEPTAVAHRCARREARIRVLLRGPGLDARAVPNRRFVDAVRAAVGAPAATPVGTDLGVALPGADAEDDARPAGDRVLRARGTMDEVPLL